MRRLPGDDQSGRDAPAKDLSPALPSLRDIPAGKPLSLNNKIILITRTAKGAVQKDPELYKLFRNGS
jgi:hypothetical protein